MQTSQPEMRFCGETSSKVAWNGSNSVQIGKHTPPPPQKKIVAEMSNVPNILFLTELLY